MIWGVAADVWAHLGRLFVLCALVALSLRLRPWRWLVPLLRGDRRG